MNDFNDKTGKETDVLEGKKKLQKILDKYLKECPDWIVKEAVKVLHEHLNAEDIKYIGEKWKNDPYTWWAMYHHGWGTNIRNLLRDEVCSDDKLPTGNFDDYYIQFVELACGLRFFEGK